MTLKFLPTILETAGISLNGVRVHSSGCDPVLSSPFLIGEAGAAVLAAVGVATSRLWQLKTGRVQDVSIDVDKAALAQRSHQYLQKMDGDTPPLWSPYSGFYSTKDQRWLQFHCNFPHHQQGVLDYFGCADKEALIAAVKQQEGASIEQALNERGLCASLLRTPAQWDAHPQSRAVAQLPLFEIIRIGDSSPEPLPDGDAPLSGIRVLDLTRVLAGPAGSKLLAQLGADVLRISHPDLPFILPCLMDTGFGKRNAFIDMDKPEQKSQLLDLVRDGDVFVQAYHPGALAAKGLSPQALAQHRPGIIAVDISAYSHVGPWANRHGYDSLVQTATGIAAEQTAGADKPQHLPAQSLDYLTGYLAAFAVMEALHRRATEGGSYWIRSSLVQTRQWFGNLGRVTDYARCTLPGEEAVADSLEMVSTPFGQLQHLKPLLNLSETPLVDRSPAKPLGSDQPVWLPR